VISRWVVFVTFAALILLALPVPVQAQGAEPPGGPVVLTGAQEVYPLGRQLDVLADPTGALTIDDVRSPAYSAQFMRSRRDLPVYGFSSAAYWARVDVRNASPEPMWILNLSPYEQDHVDFYLYYDESGQAIAAKQSGGSLPFSTRDLQAPGFAFRAPIPPGQEATLYLRIAGERPLRFPLTLYSLPAYIKGNDLWLLVSASAYGFLILMVIYNLFMYVSLRDRNYLLLSLFILTLTLTSMLRDGRAEQLLWPAHPGVGHIITPLAIGLEEIFLLLFAVSFLETRSYAPKLHKALIVLIGLLIGATLLVVPMAAGWLSFQVVVSTLLGLGVPTVGLLAATGLLVLWRGNRSARYFVAAEVVPLTIGLADIFYVLGVLSIPISASMIPRLGNVLLVLFFSLALADRVRMLNLKAQQATTAAHAAERLSRQYLDAMPLGVAVYDAKLNPVYANAAASALIGGSASSRSDSFLDVALRYPIYRTGTDEPYPSEELPIHRALNGVPTAVDDLSLEVKGERLPLEVWATPLHDAANKPQAVALVFADITEKKLAEAELRRYQDGLEELVRERTSALSEANEALVTKQRVADTLSEAATLTSTGQGLEPMLTRILELLGRVIVYDGAAIFLDDGADLVMVGATGNAKEKLGQRISVVSQDSRAWVYNEGRVLILDHPDVEGPEPSGTEMATGDVAPDKGGCQWVGLPLSADGKTFGVLAIDSKDPCMAADTDITLVEAFASQAAAAVWIARLYERAQANAVTAERARLARDLHDAVTQTLFSASIFADMLPVQIAQEPDQAAKNLEKLGQLIRGALAEMRALLMELRPAALVAAELDQLLSNLTQAALARSRIGFLCAVHGEAVAPPQDVKIAIYRIVQEILNNVIKHSGASTCRIDLWYEPDGVEIAVSDNGRGFDPQAVSAEHMGLAIMRERARAIGGELTIESQPGEGAHARIRWPARKAIEES